jgi:hypothetical protein
MTSPRRTLEALLNPEEDAWHLVQEWVAAATRTVSILPASVDASKTLVWAQVTTRSPLGAVVFHSGGLLVDHGWLRILGSGHPRLPRSLSDWNVRCGLGQSEGPPPCLLIADDVAGGFFAVNGGRFPGPGNTVWYLAPDTLRWEDTRLSYTDFLRFSLGGDLNRFYEAWRFPGWESEVERLGGDQVLSFYPHLSAGGVAMGERSRRPVPIDEVFALHAGDLDHSQP